MFDPIHTGNVSVCIFLIIGLCNITHHCDIDYNFMYTLTGDV